MSTEAKNTKEGTKASSSIEGKESQKLEAGISGVKRQHDGSMERNGNNHHSISIPTSSSSDQAVTPSCCCEDSNKKQRIDVEQTSDSSMEEPKTSSSSSATTSTTQTQNNVNNNDGSIIDVPSTMNLEPGTRIQVQWDIDHEDLVNSVIVPRKLTRWWGATLLPFQNGRYHILQDSTDNAAADGGGGESESNDAPNKAEHENDEVKVPLRVLDYDPFPEGGFMERSQEDVCFLSDHSLLNMDSNSRAYWRMEGTDWEPPRSMDEDEERLMTTPVTGGSSNGDDDDVSVESASPEDGVRMVLNSVLEISLQKSGVLERMHTLPPSQQCVIAEKIANAKEKLAQKLMEQVRADAAARANTTGSADDGLVGEESIVNVITPEHVRKCMEELGNELKM